MSDPPASTPLPRVTVYRCTAKGCGASVRLELTDALPSGWTVTVKKPAQGNWASGALKANASQSRYLCPAHSGHGP